MAIILSNFASSPTPYSNGDEALLPQANMEAQFDDEDDEGEEISDDDDDDLFGNEGMEGIDEEDFDLDEDADLTDGDNWEAGEDLEADPALDDDDEI